MEQRKYKSFELRSVLKHLFAENILKAIKTNINKGQLSLKVGKSYREILDENVNNIDNLTNCQIKAILNLNISENAGPN